ncbi:MAG: D-glycero-beta-D-manno-heptose-7-phosphate kinase [Nitrospiria bacterium]
MLNDFPGKRVLVLGDVMLDHYIWGTVKRISPEAPVPVVEVNSESVRLGGAGNVLNNILGLGGEVTFCSVIGADSAGEWIQERVQSKNVDMSGLIVEENRLTIKKTRIVAHQQQVVRFDHEARSPFLAKTTRRLSDYVISELSNVDCLAISDYSKGVISRSVLRKILPAARERGIPVIVDPKVNHFALYKNVTLVTPNNLEASQASGIDIQDEASLLKAGETILKKLNCQAVLITRGEQGMSLFESDGAVTHIPTDAKEVFDVTGAGDTVLSTLALALAVGAPLSEAARLANLAAGIVVGIVGTATIEREMIQRTLAAE